MMKRQGMMIELPLMTTLIPREIQHSANYLKALKITKAKDKINKYHLIEKLIQVIKIIVLI